MKSTLYATASAIIMSAFCQLTFGQMGYPGSPVMNNEDFTPSKVIYLLPPEDPVVIEGLKSARNNSSFKALQYATERNVDLSPEFNGEWVHRDGLHIWRAHIISPEAYSLGVLFDHFELNESSKVFIYDPEGVKVKGAFTHRNNKSFKRFFVGHIPGDEVIIELQTSDPKRSYGKLRIGAVSHAFLPVYAENNKSGTGLGESQDCEIDINCPEGDPWQILKRSVVQISTSRLLCTGALVNNTAYNGKPYVLTAEHCISKDLYANSSVYYFNYENSECGVNDGKKEYAISGSHLVATGGDVDFTIVRLTEKPPREFNVYYAGWDARVMNHQIPVAIHHPNADVKKISYDFNATVNATTVPGDLNDYIVSSNYRIQEWDLGTTEGGSSGCPLFNASKRIIGILSGGLAVCGDSIGFDEENNRVIYSLSQNRNDYFSKVYYSWDHHEEPEKQIKHWLDPIGTGQLSIGGLNPMTVDIRNDEINTEFLVYPNPSDGIVRIDMPEYSGKAIFVEVYDASGKKVLITNTTSVYPVNLDLTTLPGGLYNIVLHGEKRYYHGSLMKL